MEQIRSYMSDTGVGQEEWDRIFGKKEGAEADMDEYREMYEETVERGKALLSEAEWDKWFPPLKEQQTTPTGKPIVTNGYDR